MSFNQFETMDQLDHVTSAIEITVCKNNNLNGFSVLYKHERKSQEGLSGTENQFKILIVE